MTLKYSRASEIPKAQTRHSAEVGSSMEFCATCSFLLDGVAHHTVGVRKHSLGANPSTRAHVQGEDMARKGHLSCILLIDEL